MTCDCCEEQTGTPRVTDDGEECAVLCDDCAEMLTRMADDDEAAP